MTNKINNKEQERKKAVDFKWNKKRRPKRKSSKIRFQSKDLTNISKLISFPRESSRNNQSQRRLLQMLEGSLEITKLKALLLSLLTSPVRLKEEIQWDSISDRNLKKKLSQYLMIWCWDAGTLQISTKQIQQRRSRMQEIKRKAWGTLNMITITRLYQKLRAWVINKLQQFRQPPNSLWSVHIYSKIKKKVGLNLLIPLIL
jgi:hypothetical protein